MAALVLSVTALVSTNAAGAAPTAPGVPADGAFVQFQVRPINGDATALAAALLADGYDVDGGGAGVLFVHGLASIGTALAARTDLTVIAANPINFSHAPAPTSQDSILPSRLKGKAYDTFYGGYRTADAYVEFADDLQAAYPDLVKVMKYGDTYTGDNDLRVVCVTADADTGCQLTPDVDKARFLFVAQIHARELTTSEMTWRTLTLLTDGYGSDADLTALLDETEIWIVPQINPDGIETVEKGFDGVSGGYTFQRKNMHPEGGCGATTLGTDLNRNYANSNWGGVGSDSNPCGETYHGASAGSEPETYNVQDLMKDIFEDQRGSDPSDPAPDNARGTMLTLHTYGNLSMFPYGDARHAPNNAQLRSLGFRYSHYNGYTTGETDEVLYQVSGTTDEYSYEKLGVASFTFEIGPNSGACSGFHPAFSCQDGFWNLNREAFLYAARVAQQPYVMGLGPNPVQAKSKNKGANRAVITATADDDAYGTVGVGRPASQNVTAGRVFVGTAPWDGGTAKATNVIGSGKVVTLKVTLRRQATDQLVWIQGKDASGNWGPTRAVWLRAK
jgi:carboxypeptidase T